MPIEVGNYVRVADREPTAADIKAGLFYNHFRGLEGTVERLYDDGCVCVVVEHGTLSGEMLARLKRAERLIKPRWKTGATATPEPAVAAAAAEAPPAAETAGGDEEEGETPAEAVEAAPEEDLTAPPGLRYAIVLKAEYVQPAKRGERRQAEESSGARVTESELSAREADYLQSMAQRQR